MFCGALLALWLYQFGKIDAPVKTGPEWSSCTIRDPKSGTGFMFLAANISSAYFTGARNQIRTISGQFILMLSLLGFAGDIFLVCCDIIGQSQGRKTLAPAPWQGIGYAAAQRADKKSRQLDPDRMPDWVRGHRQPER
ncbi:hypothetical protein VSX56_04760 [Thioclava sp. CPCC 100088]|uniref:Uncharacterized protein n=1 Tax=Thioclava kandeliae TaxID=3070818 RepID=A0ABV1SEB3_9RHOB